MKIEGAQKIDAPRERIFAALVDPAILKKCIPGCEQMEKTGDNQYKAKLTAGVGPVKGVFTATISLQEIVAPEHYKLVVEGKGQPGFVKGSGELNLKEADGATEIQYTGEVNVGGLIASVGQRMIQATANMLTARFFKSLEAETAAGNPTSPTGTQPPIFPAPLSSSLALLRTSGTLWFTSNSPSRKTGFNLSS